MLSHPFDVLLAALTARGARLQTIAKDQARLFCPVHRDARPSLVLTRRPDKVLFHCFAGCRPADLVAFAGLRLADLFVQGGPAPKPAQVAAVYDYCDEQGRQIQKVRWVPKTFRWRRPDPGNPSRWLSGLGGSRPRLFRFHELSGHARVFCVEGEKAANRLWEIGLASCCPPSGASRWMPEWSRALQQVGCRELVVLPDFDRPGLDHAERIATVCHAVAKTDGNTPFWVKVVQLPGLSHSQDAFDWIQDGHDASELLGFAASAPYWEPGALERMRAERRRALTRERVRLCRQRAKERIDAERAAECNAVNVRGERRNAVTA